jgi:tetratricopeptide (TPR) repeat protein
VKLHGDLRQKSRVTFKGPSALNIATSKLFAVATILFGAVSLIQAAEPGESSVPPKPDPIATTNQPNRLTVAILGFENKTGDADLEFWRVAIDGLLITELGEIRAIKVAPGVDYARRQINKKDGDGIKPDEARKAGEIIEARRVVWGEYTRDGKKWLVTARVMNVATGKISKELKATSADWFSIRDKLVEKILSELKVKPTRKEQQSFGKRWTKNPAALEWFTKGKYYYSKPNHQPDAETSMRRASEADPQCGRAYSALAAVLGTAGKLDEAEQAARKGVELGRDSSRAHLALAHVFERTERTEEARKELEKALELDPEDDESLERLGELYGLARDWPKAQEFFLKASKIDPFSASAHAHVGYAYAWMGQRDKALVELRKAESLVSPEGDVGAEQFLYYGYVTFREIPQAIAHSEKLTRAGKEQGVGPKFIAEFEEALPELKARLTPSYVEAVAPKAYTDESLMEALREKLTPEEMKNAINPMAITPEMKKWSHELTARATNDFEKGRMLLEALSRHARNAYGGRRTAQEVFLAWPDQNNSFLCEEYTYLYIALGREVGLKCYYAYIDQECDGRKLPHACAAVFLGEKCLLADPSYFWFGVPHKKYTLLNDFEVSANRLAESHQVPECEAAYKLAPRDEHVCYNLIDALIREQCWDEARKFLTEAPLLDPLLGDEIEADFAVHDEKLDKAIEILRKTIDEYPDNGALRVHLGHLYLKQEKLAQARTEYRKALPELYTDGTVEQVHFLLAQINEKLGESGEPEEPKGYVGYRGQGDFDLSKKEYDKAIADYTEAIRLNSNDAASYYGRAYAYACKHDIQKTIEDCTKTLAIDSGKVEVYHLRAQAYWKEGSFTRALADLEKAINLAPSNPTTYEMRGDMYWRRNEFAQAAKDYREVARLQPTDANSQGTYAWLLVCTKDSSTENSAAAMQAAKTACELSSWTNSATIEILAAACDLAGEYKRAVEYEKMAMNLGHLKDGDRANMQKTLLNYDDNWLRHDLTNWPFIKSESSDRAH